MSLFTIKNLTKVYAQRRVLDIAELDLRKGKIYALFGPNGSGKTTLLEILSLLDFPTSGSIHYNGMKVDYHATDLTRLRREIIMVHQQPVLFTTSVYKNLEFGLKVRGIEKRERSRVITECLDLVGMRDFIKAHAPLLSGGEKQRVAIARALACSPKVLFLDEPTASVDMENQSVIEQIISDINAYKNISIIVTTHDRVQAGRIAHEIIPLYGGKIARAVQENIFSAFLDEDGAGRALCKLRGGITIKTRSGVRGRVRISIDPLGIELLGGTEPPSKENLFQGRVKQLLEDGDKIRVLIDMGIPLNLLLGKQDERVKRLFVGESVVVHIPEHAIIVAQVFPN